ncbi:hypothetical protein QBC40DRAFT_184964, partial [Triangularia verruculosa]
KISAFEKPSTSSTPCHHLLKSRKELELSLFDSLFNQAPQNTDNNQLPHRTSCAVLPLTEEESTKPRQTFEGPVCYPHRPP